MKTKLRLPAAVRGLLTLVSAQAADKKPNAGSK